MSKLRTHRGLAGFLLIVLSPAALAAGDAVRGKALYDSQCSGCHALDANRIGPKHAGVFGRRAGTVAGFEYSPALRRSKLIWNDKTLDQWLRDPEALVPGQFMGFSVAEPADRTDLIAYLRKASGK